MDKIKISHCADALIDIMHKKHYKDSTINQYKKCFTDFLNYSKERHKEYFEEVIAIEYANLVTGLELKDLVHNYLTLIINTCFIMGFFISFPFDQTIILDAAVFA